MVQHGDYDLQHFRSKVIQIVMVIRYNGNNQMEEIMVIIKMEEILEQEKK